MEEYEKILLFSSSLESVEVYHWVFMDEQLVVLESILIHHPPVISFCTNLISIRSVVSSKGMAMLVSKFVCFSLKRKGASLFYFT